MSDHLIPSAGPTAVALANQMLRQPNRTLCYCHGVRACTIIDFLEESGTCRVRDVVDFCQAGDCCASCRFVIGELIRRLNATDPDLSIEN